MESKVQFDGDDAILAVTNNESTGNPTSSPAAVKTLNLSRAHDLAEEKDDGLEAQMARKSKSEILVIFELPDGSQVEDHFMLGHTVEVLKAFLAADLQMDFAGTKLFIGGEDGAEEKMLLDPMQIADYVDGQSKDDLYVRVEGEMEDTGRK